MITQTPGPHTLGIQRPPRALLDRRRHKRISVTLLGRFMRSNRREYPCKLIDISVGGAALMAPVELEESERIVAYFDHLGGLEGSVARIFEGGFAMRLAATRHRREKLSGVLTWLINRAEIRGDEARRHERLLVPAEPTSLQLGDGAQVPCRILDVSVSGALLGTDVRPAVGQEVGLGKLRARVIRHHETGIGVQFVDIQNPVALRRYFS